MDRQSENKLILVHRKTRLDEQIVRFSTRDQARFYVQQMGLDFSDYEDEDEQYKACLLETRQNLAEIGRVQLLERSLLPNYVFGPQDTVVVLGQDGLVANTLKYVSGQPVLGVNPDPKRWEGILLPFVVSDLELVLPEVFARKRPIRLVSMAKASLNTGEVLYGVNDIFIGPRTHTSARYTIKIGDRSEPQSSSGVIISTGLGSTGWLRSILAGATGISASLSGQEVDTAAIAPFAWDAEHLYFSVREPWASKTSSAGISFGKVTPEQPLYLESSMPENGVIFSDGMEADFLQFQSGTIATISLAEKRGQLVV
ncbi:MAG: sugar kinase [Chloroflexota bacterium]